MMSVYTAPTANCQRVTVMLEAVGLPYEVHRIDRTKGEQRTPAFQAINPAAAVPVLLDPDGPGGSRTVVTQSGAILLYLAEKTGRFLPATHPGRIRVLQWFLQVMTDVNPASSLVLLMSKSVEANPEVRAFARTRLVKFLGDCEQALTRASYLAGELSIADLALYPIVASRRDFIADTFDTARLLRWCDDLDRRPELRRGLAAA
jgi:GST-like protein